MTRNAIITHDLARNEWIFPNGKRLPVVSGGDPTADPTALPVQQPDAVVTTAPVTAVPTDPAALFTAADIENARKQEKDKLYTRIDRMGEQLELFNKEREETQRLQAEQANRTDEERKRREQEEMSFKELLTVKEDEFQQTINKVQIEWEQKFTALEEERNAQAALLEKERRFQELTSYKNRRIQEAGDTLMPELLEFIQGDSEDSIEASISAVAARTSAIVENIQQMLPQQRSVRPVPATGQAPNGPLENQMEQQTYSMNDIKNMDMGTYAANRERLLSAVARR